MNDYQNVPRVNSLDLLRGIAVVLMVFITDAAGIFTTPNWLRVSADANDTLTIGDLCLPWFLMICGAVIPIAFPKYMASRGDRWKLAYHILTRTLSLWIMGILIANAPFFGGTWRSGLWEFVLLTSLIGGWTAWPKSLRVSPTSQSLLRISAMIVVALLAAYYGSQSGEWLTLRGWGVLGMIGWGYLIGALVYLVTAGNITGLVALAAILLATYQLEPQQWLSRIENRSELGSLQPYIEQMIVYLVRLDGVIDIGTIIGPLGGCVVVGSVLGVVARDGQSGDTKETLKKIAGFLLALLAAAVVYDARYGINRSQSSPAWILYSVLIASNLWLILWGVADRVQRRWGLQWLADIGANSLLAYLLVPWLLALIQLMHWDIYDRLGQESFWNPLWRPAIVTAVVASITSLSSRFGFRMHL